MCDDKRLTISIDRHGAIVIEYAAPDDADAGPPEIKLDPHAAEPKEHPKLDAPEPL